MAGLSLLTLLCHRAVSMLLKELSSLASPLSAPQVDKLKQLTAELSPLQLAWVSGYLAASAQGQEGAPPKARAGKL